MSKFIVQKIQSDEYAVLILGTSYDGVFMHIDEVESKLRTILDKGWIIIDSLLKTGGNVNRFSSLYFDGEKLNYNTAKNVFFPRDSKIRIISTKLLCENQGILVDSILSSQQINLIKHGVVV